MWMCHLAFSKKVIRDHVKYCPKCSEEGKQVKMDFIMIDPPSYGFKAWATYICPMCHYEVSR